MIKTEQETIANFCINPYIKAEYRDAVHLIRGGLCDDDNIMLVTYGLHANILATMIEKYEHTYHYIDLEYLLNTDSNMLVALCFRCKLAFCKYIKTEHKDIYHKMVYTI